MDQWDLEIKKDSVHNEMKRQPTEWDNIFASYISKRGLKSKMYKELKKTKQQKMKPPHQSNEMDNCYEMKYKRNI